MSVETPGAGVINPSDPPLVAVLEDDQPLANVLRRWLTEVGYRTVTFTRATPALASPSANLSAFCLDLHLPDAFGLDVLEKLHALDPDLPVIVTTAVTDVDVAIHAIRAGAYDYVVKPMRQEHLLQVVRRAVERRTLSNKVLELQRAAAGYQPSIVGTSGPMRDLARQIERVHESDVTVCIMGESGTGKELVARALHAGSRRHAGPFVAMNCAALTPSLLESQLFGHDRGAFTGAATQHRGRFEQAHGGTFFLDELGEMAPDAQAALLRVLTTRTITRVGGTTEIPVDVRMISATNRDLAAEVAAKRFREDLYYRLVVYPIAIPPLRDRKDDIPALVAHFLGGFRRDVGRDVRRVSPEALDALMRFSWPGNVRQLESFMHRAMLSCDGPEITLAHLPLELPIRGSSVPPAMEADGGTSTHRGRVHTLREVERKAIEDALRVAEGRVSRAAELLGMSRATLYRRLAAMEGTVPVTDEPRN